MTGLHRSPDHRYSWNDGPWVPGVTAIIGIKDRSGPLVGWAKRETARCAVDNHDAIGALIKAGGRDAAIDWLKGIPDFQRDTSADLGSVIHAEAERLAIMEAGEGMAVAFAPDLPPEALPYLATYRRDFLDRFRPTFRAVEYMVWSEAGYGGTGDAICIIDGETWSIDHKTGKGIYPDAALQLAALASADLMGFPDDPQPYAIPKADRYGIVHIGPERTRLVEYHVGPAEVDAFRSLLAVRRWQDTRAKEVTGDALK